jgi:ABC-type antimicrobial peptide transport system permease subunit
LSFALSRLMSSWTPQAASDPVILVGVIVLLAGTATAACLLPALRASTIDPMKALRFE